ncbi:MAG TPA: glycosyltransferase family 2 protein, partial [Acidimicrobiales bacterium]|nr:glycosyltransferase family 2 protein [Acidimicrobiales bacterium]
PDGSVQESARRFPSVPRLVARRTPVGKTATGSRWLSNYLAPSYSFGPVEVDWVIGAVMYIQRVAIEAVGGFDEAFFLYGEDVDLCARTWKAGMPVVFHGEVYATHSYARASKRTFDFRRPETRHHWMSIIRLARRYPKQFFQSQPMERNALRATTVDECRAPK